MSQPTTPYDPLSEGRRVWEEQWGTEGAAEMFTVASVSRAHQLMLTELNRILRPFELTFARYHALMLLTFSRRGSMSLSRLGARLQVHPTSVTNVIDRLEAAGLAVREPHEHDRRATRAALTPKGRDLGARATHALQEQFSLPGLDRSELEELIAQVSKLRVALGDVTTPPRDAAALEQA